ncbi:unnamed protein product [Merluccius merluccius]
MELKAAVLLLLLLAAFCITSTEAGIPKCCIQTSKRIPLRLLVEVEKWEVQLSNGACDIPALILHVRNRKKPVCADPRVKKRFRRKLRFGAHHAV